MHGRILAASYYPAEAVASIADGHAAETPAADAAVARLARKVAQEAQKATQDMPIVVSQLWPAVAPDATLTCAS